MAETRHRATLKWIAAAARRGTHMVLDPVCVAVCDILCVCVNNKNESETKQESQAQGATFDSRL